MRLIRLATNLPQHGHHTADVGRTVLRRHHCHTRLHVEEAAPFTPKALHLERWIPIVEQPRAARHQNQLGPRLQDPLGSVGGLFSPFHPQISKADNE